MDSIHCMQVNNQEMRYFPVKTGWIGLIHYSAFSAAKAM